MHKKSDDHKRKKHSKSDSGMPFYASDKILVSNSNGFDFLILERFIGIVGFG